METPGPGHYSQRRSDFGKAIPGIAAINTQGTYLVNDNGHINQRTSSFLPLTHSEPKTCDTPGPGQYESPSLFKIQKPVPASRQFQARKVSSPTIPSKLLSPVIDSTIDRIGVQLI